MMRGCAWTIVAIIVVVAVLIVLGSLAPEPPGTSNARLSLDLTKPVYIAKDAVLCEDAAVIDAYLSGHHAGGEAEGHRRVTDLFVHPPYDCARTISRDLVRVLDKTVSDDKLVNIEWPGAGKYETLPSNLSN